METSYRWEDGAGGATVMTLRNRGERAGFAKVTAPVLDGCSTFSRSVRVEA
jgi:hypothetical protein